MKAYGSENGNKSGRAGEYSDHFGKDTNVKKVARAYRKYDKSYNSPGNKRILRGFKKAQRRENKVAW